ncbi:hypothetical protein B1R27_37860 [Streptomyces sp. GKU 895]|nr:hypothetical protein B1R27_37860 [Streptomyces sp. GKU 895]
MPVRAVCAVSVAVDAVAEVEVAAMGAARRRDDLLRLRPYDAVDACACVRAADCTPWSLVWVPARARSSSGAKAARGPKR